MDKRTLAEIGWIAIAGFILFFVSTNVNPALGGIYQGLAILGGVILIGDLLFGKKSLKLVSKKINWVTAIFIAIVAYVILIFSSYFLSSLSEIVPLTEILSLLGASAPVFSSSAPINFLIFAILIPFVETYVIFGLALDLFSSVFNINLNKGLFSGKMILLILALSAAFLLFHVNAKGIESESALLLVGVMGLMSCGLIIIYKEFRIAILFHIIANTIASLPALTGFVT